MRFRSTQRWSSSPTNNVKKNNIVFILLHDINYISVLPYECSVVHLSYNNYVSLRAV